MNKIFIIAWFLISFCGIAQEKVFSGDPDKAFEIAREMAFNNQRKQAQDSLLFILTKHPDYHDIREFLATTYSWDGKRKEARKEFNYVLERNPKRRNTWEAAIKNELWGDNPHRALDFANKALKHFPGNPDLMYLKASATDDIGDKEEALIVLEKLLEKTPEHEKANSYNTRLKNELSKNVIGLKSSVDIYSRTFDPMQYYLLKYVRRTKFGSIHSKLNVSYRFAKIGAQFEVDMYPKIAKGLYAYISYGVSNSSLYPDYRYGAELHKSLPLSLEISFGFRALKFSSTTTIYTGSIGWYTGNDYWSFRTYVTPGEPKASKSGTLSYRKYRSDANNYLSMAVGMGISPEEDRYNNVVNSSIINLKSQKLKMGYYFSSKNNKNSWGIQTGVSHQEISFDPGSYFWIYSFSLSWDLIFR